MVGHSRALSSEPIYRSPDSVRQWDFIWLNIYYGWQLRPCEEQVLAWRERRCELLSSGQKQRTTTEHKETTGLGFTVFWTTKLSGYATWKAFPGVPLCPPFIYPSHLSFYPSIHFMTHSYALPIYPSAHLSSCGSPFIYPSHLSACPSAHMWQHLPSSVKLTSLSHWFLSSGSNTPLAYIPMPLPKANFKNMYVDVCIPTHTLCMESEGGEGEKQNKFILAFLKCGRLLIVTGSW